MVSKNKIGISLCMIVKDEERFLSDCLNSVKGLVDEIIIVDTGSSDRTVEIAKSFGAKVYFFDWSNDFSKPRNISLSKATGDWIIVLDPDERIALKDHEKIRMLISEDKNVAYSMPTRNYSFSKKPFLKFFDSNDEYKQMNEEMPFFWISNKVRLFPNNKLIKFQGRVHEIVEESIKKQGVKIEPVNIPVHHYAQLDKKRSRSKRFFYMNITRKKVLKKPENAKSYLELGREYFNLRLYHRAIQTFKKGVLLTENKTLLSEMNKQIGNAYGKIGNHSQAKIYFMKSENIKRDNKGVIILSYHDIGDHESEWCLSIFNFKKQINFLIEQGYEFVTIDEIEFHKKQVVLTFDDGRLSVYKKVHPFLQQNNIKATIFITTDWIEEHNIPLNENYSKFMNWNQVKDLSEKGYLIGSHTVTHKDLTFLKEEDIREELQKSKEILEKKTGLKIKTIAYPYGHYNDTIIKIAEETNYQLGLTEDIGYAKTKNLTMNRIYITRKKSFEDFKSLFL